MALPVIIAAFLIATALRVAQGSATVALTTAAGLIAPAVRAENVGDFHLVLVVVAIAAGATVLSHVNDSGFWMAKEYFNMSIKETILSWTLMEGIVGVVGILGVLTMSGATLIYYSSTNGRSADLSSSSATAPTTSPLRRTCRTVAPRPAASTGRTRSCRSPW